MRRTSSILSRAIFLSLLTSVFTGAAWGQGALKILHNFGGSGDGFHPHGALIFDSNGNLYGTATSGPGSGCDGNQGCGVAFDLSPNSDGTWTEDVLHSFSGADGANPLAGLAFDRRGNLYGTTYDGGIGDFGTVFKLAPSAGGSWILSTLYQFPSSGAFGALPMSGVSFDHAGRLYGTASEGGRYNDGIVYNLLSVSVFSWNEILAHSFGAPGDGALPYYGSLIFDASGNAYGTTNNGGANGVGTVYKLTPNRAGFGWTETVLYSFVGTDGCGSSGPDGVAPAAGLTFDSAGNLYGTTQCGGTGGLGTVFKLTHNSDDTWTESVIYSFQGGSDGANPLAPVIFDAAGSLYGTTCCGGAHTDGTIFKLSPSNGPWTETTLYTFSYTDGSLPGPVIFDNAGNLYGTTVSGGTHGPNGGVAYEFIP